MNLKNFFKTSFFTFCIFISSCCVTYATGGYDNFGFDEKGIHQITKQKYDRYGFDKEGIHIKTKSKLDLNGYDVDGYKKGMIYNYSTVKNRYGKDGFNHRGFNRFNIHRDTKTFYDLDGFNCYGFNVNGINKYTNTKYDAEGYDINGIHMDGYSKYRTGMAPTPLFNAV